MSERTPVAEIRRSNSWWSWYWLIPLAAVAVGAWLGYEAIKERGPRIVITFEEGYGLSPGDTIRHRGIDVGRVLEVGLSDDFARVEVRAELSPSESGLAREGSQFWIVRPEVSLTRVSGLDTIIGPRYVVVQPGEGRPTSTFVGLEAAPPSPLAGIGEDGGGGGELQDGLRVVLLAERVGSLTRGSPVYFRELEVGRVESIDLSSDARRIEVAAVIDARFSSLVRDNTRFWNASGFGVDMGFSGLKVRTESIAALVKGGIAFATPESAGERVEDGHRFELSSESQSSWLRWEPDLTDADGL